MKKYIGIFVVVLAVIGGGFYFTSKQKEESKKPDVLKEAVENEVKEDELVNKEEIYDESSLIKYVHRLSHPVVRANEKWHQDVIPVKTNVEKAIDIINEEEYELDGHAEETLRILEDFTNANFNEGDKLHNMMWSLQGGEVGKAKGIDVEATRVIKEKYY